MTNKWIAETRAVELRAIAGLENSFEGMACRYGVEDSYGTTFVSGCFTRGGLDNNTYSLLWMHDPNRPVGTFKAVERKDGLYIVGKWDDTAAGRDARMAAMSGSASDLSVGFTWYQEPGQDEEMITIARLQEVSQVTSRFGAVPGSVLTAVRNAVEAMEDRWTTEYTVKEEIVITTDIDQGTVESEEEERLSLGNDIYTTKEEAEAKADSLGCKGSHSMDMNGEKVYMPCNTHDAYLEVSKTGYRAEADELQLGDFVEWNSSGGTARGRIEHIMTEGELGIPESDFVINATPEDPAALIRLVRYDEEEDKFYETEQFVGHRFSTLTKIELVVETLSDVENNTADREERRKRIVLLARYLQTLF